MNLKSFATQRFLEGNRDLLKLVIENKEVPVHLLTNEFDAVEFNVIESARMLSSDNYMEYLRNVIHIGLVKTGDNTFEISGDIPEDVLDVVGLIHGVGRDELVDGLIRSVMSDFHHDKEIEIGVIEFGVEPSMVLKLPKVHESVLESEVVEHSETPLDTVDLDTVDLDIDDSNVSGFDIPLNDTEESYDSEIDYGSFNPNEFDVDDTTYSDLGESGLDNFDPEEFDQDVVDMGDDGVVENDMGATLKDVYDAVVDTIYDRRLHERLDINV